MTDGPQKAALMTAKEVFDLMAEAYIGGADDALWCEKIPAWTQDEARASFVKFMDERSKKLNGKG